MRSLRPLVLLLALLALAAPADARVRSYEGLEVTEEQEDLVLAPGESATATYHVHNRANATLTLAFTMKKTTTLANPVARSENATYYAMPVHTTLSPTLVEIPPGGTATLRLDAVAAEAAEPDQVVTITILARGAFAVPIAEITITVEPAGAGWLPWVREAGPLVPIALGTFGVAAFGLSILRRDPLRYGLLAPILVGYTRMRRSELLDHRVRSILHDAIEQNPGIRYADLKRDLALNAGVLVHHLRMLEQHRLVASRREGTHRRYYPGVERLPEPEVDPLTAAQRRVLDAIGAGGATRTEIARQLGLTQQGANYHLKSLERRGRILARFEAGEWRVYPADAEPPHA